MGILKSNRRSIQQIRRRYDLGLGGGVFPWDFDPALAVLTPAMAKRIGKAAYSNGGAPIVQGKFDGSGVPDALQFPRGDLVHNQAQLVFADFDPYQGTIVFFWTPELSRDATHTNDEMLVYISSSHYVKYEHDSNRLRAALGGQSSSPTAFSTVAGTTYCISVSWNCNNPIDGTNYVRWSVNDTHSFTVTTQPTVVTADADCTIGSQIGALLPANAIIEGLTIYNRVLYDGTYGHSCTWDDSGAVDELAAIYAAGAGADPASVTGWEGIVFCLPTDADTTTALAAAGQAHSGDHVGVGDLAYEHDGGYLGGAWVVEYNATTTIANAGSAVALDDMPNGANGWTWEGYIRPDGLGELSVGTIVAKRVGTAGFLLWNASSGLNAIVFCAGTDATSRVDGFLPVDGKHHHVVMVYRHTAAGGDGKIYFAVDGVWASYDTQTASVGAYDTDATFDLIMGNQASGNATIDGALGWQRSSDINTRYTVGTDFIPPRAFPGADGNTIEAWSFADGSGGTVVAQVASPGNDATLTDGTWSATEDQYNTPVVPQSIQFFQENDGIDFGSGANIDDLFTADCTLEWYGRISKPASNLMLFTKSNAAANTGWYFQNRTDGGVRFSARFGGTSITLDISGLQDDVFHHLSVDFDFGTLTAVFRADGTIYGAGSATAVGAYQTDAAQDCIVNGINAVGTSDGLFTVGWIRLSDTRRYTGTYFVPPGRVNCPGNDANAHLLVPMTDGAGTTATDISGNGYNGTITFGATTRWNNTPDTNVDEPGALMYANAITYGADGANDGVEKPIPVTADADYALFFKYHVGQSGAGSNDIQVYDNIGAAGIVTLVGPTFTGVHTGANNSATLIDANARWMQMFVGWKLYNITDGSSTTITAISGDFTTCTGVLAGGTDNDWDTNDVYLLRPPSDRNYAQYPVGEWICFHTPVGCTEILLRKYNPQGEGMVTLHSLILRENLVVNGDHESLTGANPDLITGFTNALLDPGDTQSSAGGVGTIHSGAEALQWAVGASNEGMYYPTASFTIGSFFAAGLWSYGSGDAGFTLETGSAARGVLQNDTTTYQTATPHTAVWLPTQAMLRSLALAMRPTMRADTGAGANRFTDDFYVVAQNAVTLSTVTPASLANSTENGGTRVDGLDTLVEPIPAGRLYSTFGWLRWRMRPRHGNGIIEEFQGGSPNYVASIYFNGTNNILIYSLSNTSIVVQIEVGGVVTTSAAWTPTNLVADFEQLWEVRYNAVDCRLFVDSVLVAMVTPGAGINFGANVPNAFYAGTREVNGDRQIDAVFLAP